MRSVEIPAVATDVKRVLLVDDDTVLTTGLAQALETQGYLVRAVHRGEQALEEALRFRPDLVLLDVMMPVVDGWEVLGRLRKTVATEHVPVIMLTAADTEAAKVRGFTLGADDYVSKPFGLQELRCRIAAVLRRSHAYKSDETGSMLQVVSGRTGVGLIRSGDVYYVEGIRNYTYVHTVDDRHLSRITLGELDDRRLTSFMRVHRSYIVNMEHVKGCGWANKSSYRLHLSDAAHTEIPVSRVLVSEVQRRLGLRA